MSSLTSKQVRLTLKELSPKPGYIMSYTRNQFIELFDELETDIDIMDSSFAIYGDSVAKRFKAFLELASDEDVQQILDTIRANN